MNMTVDHQSWPILQNFLQQKKIELALVPETDIFLFQLMGKRKKTRAVGYGVQGFLPIVPFSIGLLLNNKYATRLALKKYRVPVPASMVTHSESIPEWSAVTKKLGQTLVVKQENATRIERAQTSISSPERFEKVFKHFQSTGENVVVEEQLAGPYWRVYFDQDGWLQVIEELPVETLYFSSQDHFQPPRYQVIQPTQAQVKKIKALAQKVLAVVSPMQAVSFRIGWHSSTTPAVIDVYHSHGPHLPLPAKKGSDTQRVGQRVAHYVAEWLEAHAAQ